MPAKSSGAGPNCASTPEGNSCLSAPHRSTTDATITPRLTDQPCDVRAFDVQKRGRPVIIKGQSQPIWAWDVLLPIYLDSTTLQCEIPLYEDIWVLQDFSCQSTCSTPCNEGEWGTDRSKIDCSHCSASCGPLVREERFRTPHHYWWQRRRSATAILGWWTNPWDRWRSMVRDAKQTDDTYGIGPGGRDARGVLAGQ